MSPTELFPSESQLFHGESLVNPCGFPKFPGGSAQVCFQTCCDRLPVDSLRQNSALELFSWRHQSWLLPQSRRTPGELNLGSGRAPGAQLQNVLNLSQRRANVDF